MKRFLIALGLALVVISGAACGANPLNAAPVRTDQVDMPKSYKFAPAVIEVKVGTTVTWRNDDNFTHSVKILPDGKTMIAQPGQTVQITFDKPGTYDYICTFHPNDMKGKVEVVTSP